MSERVLKNIEEFIEEHDSFIITSHIRSDGDSIGSELAIAEILEKRGKKTYIYNNDKPADYLSFLPGFEKVNPTPPENVKDYSALFVLDSSFSVRMGEEVFSTLSQIPLEHRAAIDHHPNPEFNYTCYINPKASSTAELVFDFLEFLDEEITPSIALNLYVAIFTDTNGFRQQNTTLRSMLIAPALYEKLPIKPWDVCQLLYEKQRYEGVKLLGRFLDTVKFNRESGLIYGIITRNMFDETGADDEDIEGFIRHLRSVKGSKIACILRETVNRDEIKINLRAKTEEINLSPFVTARGGGGHAKAAGYSVHNIKMEEAESLVIGELEELLESVYGS